MMITNVDPKVQIRVFVPANVNARLAIQHTEFQEWVCKRFGGFSVNPTEIIHGAWLNPATGKIECDRMMVYYIWINYPSWRGGEDDCGAIAGEVKRIFGETAVSIIRDNSVFPTIYS